VADETTRAIDRLFDFIDDGIETADRVLNRSKHTEEQLQGRSKKRREVIDADAEPKPVAKPSPSTVVAKSPHFYIVESVDPKSGATLYVVTDGGNARAECTTRELAGQILRALEKSSSRQSGESSSRQSSSRQSEGTP
jgi:hypothetical protein